MKKLWFAGLALTLSLGLAACSDNNSNENASKENNTNDKAAENTADVKTELMTFYLDLTTDINGMDKGLSNYIEGVSADEPPTGDDLKKLKEEGAASAEQVANEVKSIEIPATLDKYKDDLEAFKTSLTDYYSMSAEELKKEGEANLDAAKAKFEEADAKMGSIMEDAGLTASSLDSDLNG